MPGRDGGRRSLWCDGGRPGLSRPLACEVGWLLCALGGRFNASGAGLGSMGVTTGSCTLWGRWGCMAVVGETWEGEGGGGVWMGVCWLGREPGAPDQPLGTPCESLGLTWGCGGACTSAGTGGMEVGEVMPWRGCLLNPGGLLMLALVADSWFGPVVITFTGVADILGEV